MTRVERPNGGGVRIDGDGFDADDAEVPGVDEAEDVDDPGEQLRRAAERGEVVGLGRFDGERQTDPEGGVDGAGVDLEHGAHEVVGAVDEPAQELVGGRFDGDGRGLPIQFRLGDRNGGVGVDGRGVEEADDVVRPVRALNQRAGALDGRGDGLFPPVECLGALRVESEGIESSLQSPPDREPHGNVPPGPVVVLGDELACLVSGVCLVAA